MIIESIRHRGLSRLIQENDPRLLRQDLVDRVRKILTALIVADDIDSFIADSPPGWRVHRLSGYRRGDWSVSVSANWRITFQDQEGYLANLNLEDYH